MKKILTTDIVENTRRQPFNKASLEHIQEAFQEVFAEVMKALTSDVGGVIILHGITDSNGGATDWDITAGAVFYNGEVFEVPASGLLSHATQVPVLSLTTTYRTGDPVTFSDNNTFNVHAIRKLTWALGVSGSGIADFADLDKRLGDVIRPNNTDILYVDSAGASSTKQKRLAVQEIGDWNMDSTATKTVNMSAEIKAIFDSKKVISVQALIRDDTNASVTPLASMLSVASGSMNGGIGSCFTDGTGTITLRRYDTGSFDAAGFDSTSFNRGWIVIEYTE